MKPLMTIALLAAALPATAENWVRYAQSADVSRYYDKERVLLMSGTAFIWDCMIFSQRRRVSTASRIVR